jgi:uncharacterized phage protein (TIGR01671 family)
MFSAEEMATDQMCLLPTGKFINVHSGSFYLSEIDHDGVMIPLQYTGLHDGNGKEIYEGDVVRYFHEFWNSGGMGEDRLGVIEWDKDNACFTMHGTAKYTEVVGNIYENGSLMK